MVNEYLFKEKRLYMPNYYIHQLLVCEAHEARLMR